jgi:broad specificity phosphatase PhoE
MKPNPIIFVRHGETDWNKNGLIQGTADTDLNETGRAQAAHVGKLLANMASELENYQIIVSPQRRAQQTAEAVVRAMGRKLDGVDDRVRELGFGIWEGKAFWELKASPVYPADAESRFFWRPELGESYEDGVARVSDWRAALTKPTLVISHGAVGRCLMGSFTKLGPGALVNLPTPQGKFCVLKNQTMQWFDGGEVPA